MNSNNNQHKTCKERQRESER